MLDLTSMEMAQSAFKASCDSGLHHILQQCVPQINYMLNKEVPPFVCSGATTEQFHEVVSSSSVMGNLLSPF